MVTACLQLISPSDTLPESRIDLAGGAHSRSAAVVADLGYGNRDAMYFEFQTEAMDRDSEAETQLLLGYVAGGDASAFWRLWGSHQKYLYGLCLRQMGGVQEDAEDALSRAMLKAWDKLPRYAATITDVRAWLARLISNLCVDIHREKRRRTRGAVSFEEMMAADREPAPPSERSPEESLLSREMLGFVTHALEELPPRLREPFVLRFLKETAYREIAEQLAITTDNTRKRVQQARAMLRARLNSYLLGSAGLRVSEDFKAPR